MPWKEPRRQFELEKCPKCSGLAYLSFRRSNEGLNRNSRWVAFSMTKVLVTGYGGFLGAEITRRLLALGWHVRGVARGTYPELAHERLETVQGDITDRKLVLSTVQGCDAIVHTAAKAGVWGPWSSYYNINTLATSHLLEAAHNQKVKAFVHTSSPSVTFDGQHQSGVDETAPYPKRWLCFYPQTKALAEQAVLEASKNGELLTCALRPHLIWGRGDPHLFPRVIQRTLSGRLRRVGQGNNLIDVVHVSNAANAHVAALQRMLDGDRSFAGESFFLTDGRPIECWEWISKILNTAGVEVPDRSISFKAAYAVGAMLEAAFWTFRIKNEPPMTRFVAAQLALDHYFSIDKAKRFLGYEPEIDIEEELSKCQSWLQNVANDLRSES